MSPRIEAEIRTVMGPEKSFYFFVDLNHSQRLDLQEFDNLVKQIGRETNSRKFNLKYVVAKDILYFFSEKESHAEFYPGGDFESRFIQAAGFFELKLIGQEVERGFFGYSDTLVKNQILTEEESQNYKTGSLKDFLGEKDFYYNP